MNGAVNALSDWPRNRLLLALPSRNLKRLMPELEQICCQRAQILMDADSSLDHVFFPDSGVVSVVAVYADGRVIEMATIGREGSLAPPLTATMAGLASAAAAATLLNFFHPFDAAVGDLAMHSVAVLIVVAAARAVGSRTL